MRRNARDLALGATIVALGAAALSLIAVFTHWWGALGLIPAILLAPVAWAILPALGQTPLWLGAGALAAAIWLLRDR